MTDTCVCRITKNYQKKGGRKNMREYSFIKDKKDNCFYLVQTNYRHVVVWGIGGTPDRKTALKQAKDHCKNTIAKLHIEG